jgi:hypothetical protein
MHLAIIVLPTESYYHDYHNYYAKPSLSYDRPNFGNFEIPYYEGYDNNVRHYYEKSLLRPGYDRFDFNKYQIRPNFDYHSKRRSYKRPHPVEEYKRYKEDLKDLNKKMDTIINKMPDKMVNKIVDKMNNKNIIYEPEVTIHEEPKVTEISETKLITIEDTIDGNEEKLAVEKKADESKDEPLEFDKEVSKNKKEDNAKNEEKVEDEVEDDPIKVKARNRINSNTKAKIRSRKARGTKRRKSIRDYDSEAEIDTESETTASPFVFPLATDFYDSTPFPLPNNLHLFAENSNIYNIKAGPPDWSQYLGSGGVGNLLPTGIAGGLDSLAAGLRSGAKAGLTNIILGSGDMIGANSGYTYDNNQNFGYNNNYQNYRKSG